MCVQYLKQQYENFFNSINSDTDVTKTDLN